MKIFFNPVTLIALQTIILICSSNFIFSVKTKSNLLLFIVITTILLSSPLVSGDAFADKDDDKKKKTFEQMCAKKKGNEPDALFCQAILGLQRNVTSFFDIFTELRTTDTNLQNQINSFFDIFVELDDVADKQCPSGQVATGTNLDGALICTDITQNQDCDDGFYVSGIDDNGKIKCKPLPSGSNFPICGNGIVESPEQCDLGISNGGTSSCSATCTIETTDLCLGVNTDDENQCTIDACNSGTGTATHTNSPAGTACNTSGGDSCDGAGSCVVSSACDADTNPVCILAFPIPSVSGDLASDFGTISDNGEKWYNITIREDSNAFGSPPEATISLDSGSNDYDLYVYCETCGGTLIGSSTLPAGITDVVSVRSGSDDSIFGGGLDNTFTVLIEVRSVSVTSCSDYTLTVAGNTVVGIPGLC